MILTSSMKFRDSFSSLSNRLLVELKKLSGFPEVLSASKDAFPPARSLFFLACISLISCLVSLRLNDEIMESVNRMVKEIDAYLLCTRLDWQRLLVNLILPLST